MTEYRRPYIPDATWFFTVNLAERNGNRLLVDKIDILREVFAQTKKQHPFRMDAIVVLGKKCARLAAFKLSPLCRRRNLSNKLG